MMLNKWDVYEEAQLARYLVDKVQEEASGRSDNECLYNLPHDVYFVGNLRPKPADESAPAGDPDYFSELYNKLSPIAFGAEFLLNFQDRDSISLNILINWSCYYRVFPTYSQQYKHQLSIDINGTNESEMRQSRPFNNSQLESAEDECISQDALETYQDRRQKREPKDSLFIRYRKINCSAKAVVTISRNNDTFDIHDNELESAIESETAKTKNIILGDKDRLRVPETPVNKIRVPESALVSEETYLSFINGFDTDILPEWNLSIDFSYRESEVSDRIIFTTEFVNSSLAIESVNIDPFLFDTIAHFDFESNIVEPFEIELAPSGFRYDKNIWGKGINCALETENDYTSFYTTHTPIYTQMRYATKTEPSAKFKDLVERPLEILDRILVHMEQYKDVWKDVREGYVKDNSKWEEEHGDEYDKDSKKFNEEISRFKAGYNLIKNNPDIQLAFKLTNETFSRSNKTEWRLFQIVFLVSQIPGIVDLAELTPNLSQEREKVDIIYFPTGGGKTEAYLAVIVFHCFFDRFRGKTAGVTAWTRFPLRLLTLQQTQRVADIIGLAELVRLEHCDKRLSGDNIDGFAVGYFVGQGGSPNEINDPSISKRGTDIITWSKVNDPIERQTWKRVVRCPSCKTNTIQVKFDKNTKELIHFCSNSQCKFPNGRLPIFIVDNDIYKRLPSVIVGTIDKLASLGNQRKLSILFGKVDGQCPTHGYYSGMCCQKDCDNSSLNRKKPLGISGPSLFIQDELHLLKEGLGTFDSHYETFTQLLLKEYGNEQPLKIIASSATIEAFERQVNHLYGRDKENARIFPGLGPNNSQSFYAETLEYPARLYVGIIPHNKTIFNSILELIEIYHREIQHLQTLTYGEVNPYGGSLLPGTDEWIQLLDFYTTSLTYFLAGRELNSLRTDLEADVNSNLQRDGFMSLGVSELTGSTTTDDVSQILEKLESTRIGSDMQDTILATSMISHGVDIDRLNSMFFFGMPRQNAEYIQASSRVGRSHVGIVFNCLHPIRERDQSHYGYFKKYHEFLGQLVEPVAINRWSKYSVNRTLPGLFMAVLLQIMPTLSDERNLNSFYMLGFVKQKISDGTLRREDFISLLESAYGVKNPTDIGEMTFCDEIHTRVNQYFDWIIGATNETFVSNVLIPQPMRSLRDVDEPITIELDPVGSQWLSSR